MENKLKRLILTHKKYKILLALVAISVLAGSATAAVFATLYTTSTATIKTPDIQLAAGPDSNTSTSFPAATVTVASTYDYASLSFSIFPSATNTPQPATYYTNLLHIKNLGIANHTLNTITISGITGATNLGSLTVYLYATQTDSPQSGTPLGSVTLTSTSTGTITLASNQLITTGSTLYVEVVGYASPSASAGSTVGFQTSINWT